MSERTVEMFRFHCLGFTVRLISQVQNTRNRNKRNVVVITFEIRGMYVVPRPLAGTYSKVEMPRPPTTTWVPSGSCALVAYHRPFCNGTSVSTQLQSPSPAHGSRVLICVDHITQARIAAENLFSDHQLFMGLQFTWVAQGCLVQQFQGNFFFLKL
jgi:hypothetical protein